MLIMTAIALVLSFVVPYGLVMLILFFIIKAAVKAAFEDKMERIDAVLRQKNDDVIDANDVIKLRDFGILSDDELEEAAELYQAAKEREENHKAFIKYEKVLSELKEIGYLNDEQYMNKSNALKKYCNKF
jgi:phosphosulfolactate phosphohydrolase-like enzyme